VPDAPTRTIKAKKEEGGLMWELTFDYGSVALSGKAGKALATRLTELNPAIQGVSSRND